MAKYLIHVKGLRELNKALNQLPEAVRGDVLEDVLTETAKPFAEIAQQHAPVLTGFLKGSIGVVTEFKTSKSVQVAIRAGAINRPPYGFYQEFGTAQHGAQPFMRPAWDALKRRAPAMIRAALRKRIAQAAAAIGRRGSA